MDDEYAITLENQGQGHFPLMKHLNKPLVIHYKYAIIRSVYLQLYFTYGCYWALLTVGRGYRCTTGHFSFG